MMIVISKYELCGVIHDKNVWSHGKLTWMLYVGRNIYLIFILNSKYEILYGVILGSDFVVWIIVVLIFVGLL